MTPPLDALAIVQAVSVADRADCMALRLAVFVAEQAVPLKMEQDDEEDVALHFLARIGPMPVATARVLFRNGGSTAKIGRVAVLANQRGTGLGARLMQAVEADPALAGADRLFLEAQVHAIGFYARLGYAAFGPEFMDAGIPHRAMAKQRPVTPR